MLPWIEQNAKKFQSLSDLTLTTAVLVEEALYEEGEDGKPVFEHPDVPFIQASVVKLTIGTGTDINILSCLEDMSGSYSLSIEENSPVLDRHFSDFEAGEIFRLNKWVPIPTGRIQKVSVELDQFDCIAQVLFETTSGAFVLRAGEVYERENRCFEALDNDESILVFLDLEKLRNFKFGETFVR